MKNIIKCYTFLILILVAYGCGKDSSKIKREVKVATCAGYNGGSQSARGCLEFVNDTDNGSDPGHNPDVSNKNIKFDCHTQSCNSSTEYCLISKIQTNNALLTHKCVEHPVDIPSCKSAEEDAKAQFPTTNNCSAWVACKKENSKITVTCYAPPL